MHAESRTRESGLDDDVFVALRHTNGAVSHLWGSWSQHAPGPRFRVTGSAASLVVTTGDTQEDVLVTGASPATDDTWGVEAASDLDRIFTAVGFGAGLTGTRRLGHLLPDLRPGRARRGTTPGGRGRRRRDRRRPRGRPRQRREPRDGSSRGCRMTGRELLDELEAQESRLVFDRFDEDTAWELGVALREAALAAGCRSRSRSAATASDSSTPRLPGSSADNDGWLARKSAVVDRYGRSSLRVGEQFRVDGGSFDEDSRLDPSDCSPHTGARSRSSCAGTGCIGTVAVSGLPQLEDHRLVVETLEAFLAARQ